MKPLTLFDLPTEDVLPLIFSQLKNPAQVTRLAGVCKKFKEVAEDSTSWNNFLKPEFRTTEFGVAKERFINSPEMRDDQYVRFDQKGKEWFKAKMLRMMGETLKWSDVSSDQKDNLYNFGVRKYIMSGDLTIERALNLSLNERLNLDCGGVQRYITSGDFTFEQAMGLSTGARLNLIESSPVHKYIASGDLTLEQAMGLSFEATMKLNDPVVRKEIESALKTVAEVVGLDPAATNSYRI